MKPTDIKHQMLVQITCGYPTATECFFFFFNMKNMPPSPWHTLFGQFILIFVLGRKNWTPLWGLPVQALKALVLIFCYCYSLLHLLHLIQKGQTVFNKKAKKCAAKQYGCSQNKTKKSQIWQNLAQTGYRDHNRVFLWCTDIRDSSLNITGQILCQKLLSKIIHLLRAILSFHIKFLNCFVKFTNYFRHA